MIVKCFGVSRDIFDSDEIRVDNSNIKTVSDLRMHLNSLKSDMILVKSYFIAVNQEYVNENQSISSADEIAIIPPVSGG